MANAMPWSVRGVDPEIREQALEAAQRSGLSVGQWLNQVLSGNLEPEDDGDTAPPAPRRGHRNARLDDLAERIERLARPRGQDATRAPVTDARMVKLLENAIEAIERIERREGAEEPAPRGGPEKIADILAGLERRLETLGREGAAPAAPRPMAQDNPAFARALAEIDARRRVLEAAQPAPMAPVAEPAPDRMRETLDLLVNRIDEMRARPVPDTTRLQDRIDEIAQRLGEWRNQPGSDDIAAMRRDLAGLADTIEQLSPGRLVALVQEAMDGVLGRLELDRAQALPARLTAPIERMHEDVQAVLREVASGRGLDKLSQEVGNLARRLDSIANGSAGFARLDEIARETEALKALVGQALRAQPFEGLARQIEALGRQVEAFRAAPGHAADRAVLDAIHDVRDRLERFDPAAALRGIEQKLSAIGRLEDKIDELARGMKSIAGTVQPLPQLDSIADRLERIDRVLETGKGKPLAGLDKLAERLETVTAALNRAHDAPAPQGDAIVRMLEDISSRIDAAQRAPLDLPMLDGLRADVSQLARQVESSGTAGLERAISDLFVEFDTARRDMRSAAEAAAERAATEALKAAPRNEANDALAAEGLLLIKRDLGEFKSAQTEAERRMRQTLEAMQASLESLVQRLGTLEAKTPVSMPAMSLETPRVAPAPASASPAKSARPETEAPGAAMPLAPALQTVPDEIEDLPLEPGMHPGEASAQPGDPKANFIAAARRAAQAAQERGKAEAETEASAKKGIRGLREAAIGRGNEVSFIVKARRPLLLGLAAIVFSFGAVKVWTGRQAGNPAQDLPPKPAVSQPASPEGAEGAEPKSTQSIGGAARPADDQAIPTLGPARDGKRGQRLSDSIPGESLTTGSIGDAPGKAPEGGRTAIAALMEQAGLKLEEPLREAALAGNSAALFEVGSRLADGRSAPRNPQAAARWFEQAANAGHAPSQYRLASLYREGRGVAKDQTLAYQWFDKAAAQGHVLAMHNAAVLLAEGVHGAPDYAGAALWFRRAAEHGIKDSQFNVAILFARGLGVNQDLVESYRWFAIAAAQGDQDAAKKRDDLAARLTKEQVAKENEKAKAFKPAKPSAAANEPGSWAKLAAR